MSNNNTLQCSNCSEPHGPADVFCESCGLDFLSGSLPAPVVVSDPTPSGDARPALRLTIEFDTAFFELMAPNGEVDRPDPEPSITTLELQGDELLIGRASQSRGVFPDIDAQAATDDPAVSTRHAVLRRGPDGQWTIRDLDSTNGTYIDSPDDQITPGIAIACPPGTTIFVGAFSKLTILESADATPTVD